MSIEVDEMYAAPPTQTDAGKPIRANLDLHQFVEQYFPGTHINLLLCMSIACVLCTHTWMQIACYQTQTHVPIRNWKLTIHVSFECSSSQTYILHSAAHQIHTQSSQRITGSDIGSIYSLEPITSNMMLHETLKVVTVTHSPHILLHFVSSFFVVITYNSDNPYDRQKTNYSACTQFFGQYSYTHRNTINRQYVNTRKRKSVYRYGKTSR